MVLAEREAVETLKHQAEKHLLEMSNDNDEPEP